MKVALLLVRHAATKGNREKRFIGATDEPLSELGRLQAMERHLPEPQRVWCSPLRRAQESAQLLWPDQTPIVLPGLRELDFGQWEGKTWEQVGNPAVYDPWIAEDSSAAFPGGETLGAFRARTTDALKEIAAVCRKEGLNSAAIVTHGGVLMALLSAHALPHHNYFHWSCPNLGGFQVTLDLKTLCMTELCVLPEVKT